MMTSRGSWCALAAAAALVLSTSGPPAHADVSPGDRITDQNIDKVKDLISPGLEWCIRHGFPLTIVETKRVEWPTAYKEATEKYSGQVKLRPDGLQLLNYVAGHPFPKLDPQDPQVAVKIMWNYEYKFNPTDDLGERALHGVYHAKHNPVKWNDPVDWAFDDVWEKRRVYAVEGVSKLPQYAFGKRVIFIDKESMTVPFSDIYDRSGELWKIWINDWSFRKKAFDGAGVIEYEDEMGFQPAIVMVDMQLEHATKAALPSHRFPGEQGWYFNQGEKQGITEDWFTVAALVAAGH